MKRSILLLALAAALVLPLVLGCAAPTPTPAPTAAPAKATEAPKPTTAPTAAPKPTTAPTVAPKPAEPVKIVFWHVQQDDSFRGKKLKEMCDAFNKANPGIIVEPVFVGNYDDLYKKSMAAIQAGNPPDMAVAYESYIAEFMKANAVIPLEPYIDDPVIGLKPADKEDIFPGYWQTNIFPEFGNKMLSFPFTKSALAMYYNKTLLKQAGINQVPKTWDEFEAACKAVTKGDVKGLAWYESASTFDGFLYSRGVKQLDDAQQKAIFNGPEAIEALDLLIRLGKAGAAFKPEGNYADQALFAQGKVAFTFGSTSGTSYYIDAIKKAGSTFEWGCTIIPQKDPKKPATVMYGANVCIFKTTDAKQRAAWQFIKWFTDTDQTADWGTTSGYTPIRKSAMKKLADSGWLDKNPVIKEVYDTVIPYSYPEPNVRGEQEIRKIIEDAWTAALTGVKSPKAALDEAVAEANKALAAKR